MAVAGVAVAANVEVCGSPPVVPLETAQVRLARLRTVLEEMRLEPLHVPLLPRLGGDVHVGDVGLSLRLLPESSLGRGSLVLAPGEDADQQRQEPGRHRDHCEQSTASAQALRLSRPLQLGLVPGMSCVEPTQALGQLIGAAETSLGIAVDAGCDVLEQKSILDLALPTRCECAREITGHRLVEHDAQGVDV